MSVYERLGVRPIINANTSLTRLGGNLLDKEVLAAMSDASTCSVDIFELQDAVSARLAALTKNEDALVTTGAAAGLVLATLACMTGPDLSNIASLIEHGPPSMQRDQVIMQRSHRMPYDPAVRFGGAHIVGIGNMLQTFDWQLDAAINERTAAILHVDGSFLPDGGLPLEQVIEIGHAAGVPVIVDAAAQQLPRENLWSFTGAGADLVVFSGGKGLRGPQCSGLIVGSRALVRACAMHASPHQRLARALKVGKEEIIGLMVAIERYLALDIEAWLTRNNDIISQWSVAFEAIPGVRVVREELNAGGQPIPRLRLEMGPPIELDGPRLREVLRSGQPRIDVEVAGRQGIFVAAECVRPDEESAVERRIGEALTGAAT